MIKIGIILFILSGILTIAEKFIGSQHPGWRYILIAGALVTTLIGIIGLPVSDPVLIVSEDRTGIYFSEAEYLFEVTEYCVREKDTDTVSWSKYKKGDVINITHDPSTVMYRNRFLINTSNTISTRVHVDKDGVRAFDVIPEIKHISATYIEKKVSESQPGNTYIGYYLEESDFNVIGIDRNGEEVQLFEGFTFSPVQLKEGNNSIEIQFVDTEGTTSTCKVSIYGYEPRLISISADLKSDYKDRIKAGDNLVPSMFEVTGEYEDGKKKPINDFLIEPVVMPDQEGIYKVAIVKDGISEVVNITATKLDNTPEEDKHNSVTTTFKVEAGTIYIDPIPDNKIEIKKIEENKRSISDTVIEQYKGTISTEEQEDSYTFTPTIDGVYRFEFSDIPNNIHHSMYLFNSEYEELDENTGIGNGNGITSYLKGGQSYILIIKQSWNTGSYTLNVGCQKPTEIISGLTQISDSIQFTDQENNYLFVPEIDGLYRFEFSRIPNSVHHSLYVYNATHEELASNTSIGNDEGITINLNGSQEYYIVVKQSWNTGSYNLNIGKQKPTIKISNNTIISDSIQFTDQENDYEFIPQNTGLYRFEFANIPNNTHHSIFIYNSSYEELANNTGIGNEEGISIECEANKTYYIEVRQSWHTGSYNMLVGMQKDTIDISEIRTVNDSVQFKDQENIYVLIPTDNNEKNFQLSNIPDNVHVDLFIYNAEWEELENNTSIGNGEGISISLESGTIYYIVVKQRWNYGSYTIDVS